MQWQRAADVAAIDELIDLSVGVAGNVAKHRVLRRPLVEAMNGHHRKQLLDGPAVGDRLKQREVAEIGVRQRLVEVLQIFRHLVHRLHQLLQLHADRPVQVLGLRPLHEREVACRKQVDRHIERLLRVVIALERVFRVQVRVGLDEIDERLFHVRRGRRWHLVVAET